MFRGLTTRFPVIATRGARVTRASLLLRASLIALSLCMVSSVALAHPHVWVTYALTVDFSGDAVTGVDHVWTFDKAYTEMALEGLDKNNDGKYDQTELAPLLEVNMSGLKEFDYFTEAKLGDEALQFSTPTSPRLEYANGILRLFFHLPLAKPAPATGKAVTFAVYDPSIFIDFEPEKTDALKFAAAPRECSAKAVDLEAEQADQQAKKLGAAMAQQFGTAAVSFGSHKTVVITCKKP
jgi:ABC-type uncharacterized transport system substrate-binding protein